MHRTTRSDGDGGIGRDVFMAGFRVSALDRDLQAGDAVRLALAASHGGRCAFDSSMTACRSLGIDALQTWKASPQIDRPLLGTCNRALCSLADDDAVHGDPAGRRGIVQAIDWARDAGNTVIVHRADKSRAAWRCASSRSRPSTPRPCSNGPSSGSPATAVRPSSDDSREPRRGAAG